MKRAVIVGDTPVALWGVEARERLRRQIEQVGMALDDAGILDHDEPLDHVVLNAGYLFDLLALRGLAEASDAVLVCPDDGRVAAAVVTGSASTVAVDAVRKGGPPPSEGTALGPDDLAGYDRHLRRSAPPLVRAVTPGAVAIFHSYPSAPFCGTKRYSVPFTRSRRSAAPNGT